jgi:hypothetical protein
MSDKKYLEYTQECGVVAERISLNTATRFTPVPRSRVQHKPTPDGMYIDAGFTHALEIKSVTTLTKYNYANVRYKLKYACKQLKGFDYTVIHIHVLKITEHLLHLVSHLEVDLVVLFTGGEPVKTLFLPRR